MYKILFLFFFTISFLNGSDDYNATQNAQDLGLYYEDYNNLMGLSGLLSGFLFMLFILLAINNFVKR